MGTTYTLSYNCLICGTRTSKSSSSRGVQPDKCNVCNTPLCKKCREQKVCTRCWARLPENKKSEFKKRLKISYTIGHIILTLLVIIGLDFLIRFLPLSFTYYFFIGIILLVVNYILIRNRKVIHKEIASVLASQPRRSASINSGIMDILGLASKQNQNRPIGGSGIMPTSRPVQTHTTRPASPPSKQKKFCPNCQIELDSNDQFCGNCGNSL